LPSELKSSDTENKKNEDEFMQCCYDRKHTQATIVANKGFCGLITLAKGCIPLL
jgi:hypothetical protein